MKATTLICAIGATFIGECFPKTQSKPRKSYFVNDLPLGLIKAVSTLVSEILLCKIYLN